MLEGACELGPQALSMLYVPRAHAQQLFELQCLTEDREHGSSSGVAPTCADEEGGGTQSLLQGAMVVLQQRAGLGQPALKLRMVERATKTVTYSRAQPGGTPKCTLHLQGGQTVGLEQLSPWSFDQLSNADIQTCLCQHAYWTVGEGIQPLQRQGVADTLHRMWHGTACFRRFTSSLFLFTQMNAIGRELESLLQQPLPQDMLGRVSRLPAFCSQRHSMYAAKWLEIQQNLIAAQTAAPPIAPATSNPAQSSGPPPVLVTTDEAAPRHRTRSPLTQRTEKKSRGQGSLPITPNASTSEHVTKWPSSSATTTSAEAAAAAQVSVRGREGEEVSRGRERSRERGKSREKADKDERRSSRRDKRTEDDRREKEKRGDRERESRHGSGRRNESEKGRSSGKRHEEERRSEREGKRGDRPSRAREPRSDGVREAGSSKQQKEQQQHIEPEEAVCVPPPPPSPPAPHPASAVGDDQKATVAASSGVEKESTGANKGIILKFNKLGAAPHINCRQARMQQQRGSALAPSANTSKQARREEMTAELQQLQQQLQKQQEQVEQKKVTEGLWASEAAALITPAEAAAAAASEQQQSSMQGLWACAAAPVPDLFSLAATEQQKEQQQPSSLWASAASPVSDLISPAALAAAEASKVAASTTPSSAPVAPGFEYHASLYSNTSLALLPPTRASMSSGLYQAEAPELNRDAIRYKTGLCFYFRPGNPNSCSNMLDCKYAHGQEELRTFSQNERALRAGILQYFPAFLFKSASAPAPGNPSDFQAVMEAERQKVAAMNQRAQEQKEKWQQAVFSGAAAPSVPETPKEAGAADAADPPGQPKAEPQGATPQQTPHSQAPAAPTSPIPSPPESPPPGTADPPASPPNVFSCYDAPPTPPLSGSASPSPSPNAQQEWWDGLQASSPPLPESEPLPPGMDSAPHTPVEHALLASSEQQQQALQPHQLAELAQLPAHFKALPHKVQFGIVLLCKARPVITVQHFDEKVVSKLNLLLSTYGCNEVFAFFNHLEVRLRTKHGVMQNGPGYLDVAINTTLTALKAKQPHPQFPQPHAPSGYAPPPYSSTTAAISDVSHPGFTLVTLPDGSTHWQPPPPPNPPPSQQSTEKEQEAAPGAAAAKPHSTPVVQVVSLTEEELERAHKRQEREAAQKEQAIADEEAKQAARKQLAAKAAEGFERQRAERAAQKEREEQAARDAAAKEEAEKQQDQEKEINIAEERNKMKQAIEEECKAAEEKAKEKRTKEEERKARVQVGKEEQADPLTQSESRPLCVFYNRITGCKQGSMCRFKHVDIVADGRPFTSAAYSDVPDACDRSAPAPAPAPAPPQVESPSEIHTRLEATRMKIAAAKEQKEREQQANTAHRNPSPPPNDKEQQRTRSVSPPSSPEHKDKKQHSRSSSPSPTRKHKKQLSRSRSPSPTRKHKKQRNSSPSPSSDKHKHKKQRKKSPSPSSDKHNKRSTRKHSLSPSPDKHSKRSTRKHSLSPLSDKHKRSTRKHSSPSPSSVKHKRSTRKHSLSPSSDKPSKRSKRRHRSHSPPPRKVPAKEEEASRHKRRRSPTPQRQPEERDSSKRRRDLPLAESSTPRSRETPRKPDALADPAMETYHWAHFVFTGCDPADMLHRACVEFLVDNKGTSNRMSVNHLWLQCCKYLPKEVEALKARFSSFNPLVQVLGSCPVFRICEPVPNEAEVELLYGALRSLVKKAEAEYDQELRAKGPTQALYARQQQQPLLNTHSSLPLWSEQATPHSNGNAFAAAPIRPSSPSSPPRLAPTLLPPLFSLATQAASSSHHQGLPVSHMRPSLFPPAPAPAPTVPWYAAPEQPSHLNPPAQTVPWYAAAVPEQSPHSTQGQELPPWHTTALQLPPTYTTTGSDLPPIFTSGSGLPPFTSAMDQPSHFTQEQDLSSHMRQATPYSLAEQEALQHTGEQSSTREQGQEAQDQGAGDLAGHAAAASLAALPAHVIEMLGKALQETLRKEGAQQAIEQQQEGQQLEQTQAITTGTDADPSAGPPALTAAAGGVQEHVLT